MARRINKFFQPKVYNPRDLIFPSKTEKKKSFKIFGIVLILLFIFLGISFLLFYSEVFKIKNIIIENSPNQLATERIEKFKGTNIILFSTAKFRKELEADFPELKKVEIIRGLPDTLKIAFQERLPAIVWQAGGKNYLVDRLGQIYQESTEMSNLPVVKDNKNLGVSLDQTVATENFINFVIELNNSFPQEIGFKITHFEINETIFQIDAITDQGWKIIFDTTRKASDQLADLKQFLADHKDEVKEYVDVRVAGRAYYQ